MVKIPIAYIAYVCDQNAPSAPQLGIVTLGQIKKDLKQLWDTSFNDGAAREDRIKFKLSTLERTDWGDIAIGDDPFLYVTFDPQYKAQAFKELKLKEEKTNG